MFLPSDLRDGLPEDHPARFVVETVEEQLPLGNGRVHHRRTGSQQYPPPMMLTLLVYCYLTRRMGSRQIEAATGSVGSTLNLEVSAG
jgi:transposase